MNVFKFGDETVLPGFDQSPKFSNGYKFKDDSVDLSCLDTPFLSLDPTPGDFAPSSSVSSELDSPDDNEFSDSVLKYLNQILMEENIEDKPSMFHDPLALRAAEKSFYEVLGEKYPASPNQPSLFNQNIGSPGDSIFGSSSEYSTNSSSTSGSNCIDPQSIGDSVEVKPSSSLIQSNPVEYSFKSSLQRPLNSTNSLSNGVNAPMDSFLSADLVANIFSDSQSILQFKRGMEEARKFLPSNNQLKIDLNYTLPQEKGVAPNLTVKVENDERSYLDNPSRGRKNRRQEDTDLEEERSSKQSALYVEESELSEMFDKVLLSAELKGRPPCRAVNVELQNGASKTLPPNGQFNKSNGGNLHAKKPDNKKMVDLGTLLINCAQSVAADDCRTAYEQLKQIRQHSSPFGDWSQRVAHIFANGLEARLAGTGSKIYKTLASKRPSAADMLKAYQLYISASPFKKISIFFANHKILELAEKARKLHIVDFGILYGFQWPILIERLSTRPGGPPKLHITGIGLPQPGFRPAELVEETGRRLAKYCERFNVPFEYNAIAKNWETIQIEDLKIRSDELLAVNCLFRFRNLLDESVVVNSPRDAVLKLVRKMNPKIFVHAILNGAYNAPFFVTRFREAFFHYSAFFDLFDTNIPREDQERLMFEREFYGREVMNIIACEGSERVERPETYKQWQVRNMRAGLKPLPLDQEVIKKLRARLKGGYHKDFMIDRDGHWMLQEQRTFRIRFSSLSIPPLSSFQGFEARMIMDPHFSEFSDSINSFKYDEDSVLPLFDPSQDFANGFKLKDGSLDFNLMDLPFLPPDPDPGNLPPSSSVSSEAYSPDDNDFSETVSKFISQILNEENMEEKPSMFHDPLALQATEKSLYEIIGEKYPPSPNQPPLYFDQHIESPDDSFFGNSGEYSIDSSTSASNSIANQWIVDHGEYKSSVLQSHTLEYSFQSTLQTSPQWSFDSINSFSKNVNGPVDPSVSAHLVPDILSDSDSILQFNKGVEEASKFLPSANKIIIDLENYTLPPKSIEEAPVAVKVERDYSLDGSRGRKNHHREDSEFEEERSSKQSAVDFEEAAELSEMFDRVLLPACFTVEEIQSGEGEDLAAKWTATWI
ncbi:hypothetical protein F0562_000968 [Nyssa sinensis]|uniref:Uncharacterized protein n=1 Tax=Nyssa sinensis TaxID=561372 RepID=A0A5J5C3B1_9ASTE|nr:hypothetical protein F0562_000968 [Nyssa sinensis]